ncbi:hypothetical protein SESBI_40466 [Sesbania bispinosa]|nr:hypothetical protein SESBI_40466 [Sesbania bispinosa]
MDYNAVAFQFFISAIPEGHQFESYKEVSAHLLSFRGVQDIRHSNSSYTDGSQQFSCNVNMASESQIVGHVSTGEIKTDANVSSSLHEKQASIPSLIGTEKLNTSDGNFNSDLALGSKLGDTTSGAFRDSDHQTDNKQPLKDDNNDANSVQGCSPAEDRVHNVRNEKLAGAIEASDASCNLYIPLVFTSPFSNTGGGIDQFSDEINAVTCMKTGIANFDSQDRNTGCYETVPCGNEQVHVDNNGLELSVRLVEDHIQKMGFESSMLAPNSEENISAGNNSEDRHLSSLVDMEISDGKAVKDDKQQLVSSRDQSEIKDFSTNVKLQYSSDGCSLVPSQNELKQSMNGMDRALTSMLKDTAEGNYFDDLPSSFLDERTCIHNGYSDFTPNLEVPKDGSDNHVPPNEEVVASCLQKRSSSNDQICTMDHLLDSSESNLFTLTGNQHLSTYHDNMNNFSAGTFDALKAVDGACLKPQLGIVSCSNVVAVDAYTSARVMQEKSQGCVSVPLGGSILNQFDSDGAVNKAQSCLSEKAKSEVEMFQTDSMGMPKFR